MLAARVRFAGTRETSASSTLAHAVGEGEKGCSCPNHKEPRSSATHHGHCSVPNAAAPVEVDLDAPLSSSSPDLSRYHALHRTVPPLSTSTHRTIGAEEIRGGGAGAPSRVRPTGKKPPDAPVLTWLDPALLHGSIMRGGGSQWRQSSPFHGSCSRSSASCPAGNEWYRKGHYGEALRHYDQAVVLCPDSAACCSNRAAALTGLGRLVEVLRECEEAIRRDLASGRRTVASRRFASGLGWLRGQGSTSSGVKLKI